MHHQISSSDPFTRVRKVEGILDVLRDHCLSEADKLSDPEVRSLLESTANVLEGLGTSFHSYLRKEHASWDTPQKSIDPWD